MFERLSRYLHSIPGDALPVLHQGADGHCRLVIPALLSMVTHRVDTDQPGREVNRFQIGKLLQLLLEDAAAGGIR